MNEEQKFAMIAQVTFDAKNIQDALITLGNHFLAVSKDPNTSTIFKAGRFQLGPVKPSTEASQTHQNDAQGTEKPPHARLHLPDGKTAGNDHIVRRIMSSDN